MKVKVLVSQSCLTLCNSVDCSPPGSSVHGILQARILEWVAIPFSRRCSLGIEPRSPALQVDSLPCEPPGKPLRSLVAIFPTMEKAQQGMIWIISMVNKCRMGKTTPESIHAFLIDYYHLQQNGLNDVFLAYFKMLDDLT